VAGENLRIGYFAQHQLEALDHAATPALHVQRLSPKASEQSIRDFLGGYGFHGEQALATVGRFSGGEQARLALALIAWQKPNLLLLDEPTNHLDLEMRHALTVALQEYAGAVLLVSHDRHLLKNTVDEFWLVGEGRVASFDGDLEDYRKLSLSRHAPSRKAEPVAAATARSDRKDGRREAAAQREQLRPLRQRVAALEKDIARIQRELDALSTRIADPSLYAGAGNTEVQALLREQGKLRQRLARCEEDWLAASEQLERLGSAEG
jgi:ATP-binding cassette subfamily F protein 3